MICRYQSDKRSSVKNYFIDLQQKRAEELFHDAETITIVGAYCSYKTDHHIWSTLARSNAIIHYLEPSMESQSLFREWAEKENKKEGKDFIIRNNRFKDGFEYIESINDL